MLTQKQKECYDAMKEYKDRNGIIPSHDELLDILGLKSKSNIHNLILGLEERGAIERIPHRARAIKLLPLE